MTTSMPSAARATTRPLITPEGKRRAGLVVAERIELLGRTSGIVARDCGVDPKTLRTFMSGRRWPRVDVRNAIEDALSWPRGEIVRHARGGVESLRGYSERDLLAELSWRAERRVSARAQQRGVR